MDMFWSTLTKYAREYRWHAFYGDKITNISPSKASYSKKQVNISATLYFSYIVNCRLKTAVCKPKQMIFNQKPDKSVGPVDRGISFTQFNSPIKLFSNFMKKINDTRKNDRSKPGRLLLTV